VTSATCDFSMMKHRNKRGPISRHGPYHAQPHRKLAIADDGGADVEGHAIDDAIVRR